MARFQHKAFHHAPNITPPAAPVVGMPAPVVTPPVVTPVATAPAVDPVAAPVAAPLFSDIGTTFNDATRAMTGGLWQNAVEEGGQGLGSVFRYVNDLHSAQTGLQAEVTAGQFSGTTLAHVQTILSDMTTAISAATASVNGGGAFGSVAAAEQALHTSHLDVLNIVQNDPGLSSLAAQNGATGFMAAPSLLANGATAANAPHANLADIGAIFNDAVNRSLGGVNGSNSAAILSDVTHAESGLKALIADNPHLFGGLTGIHADTIVRQLELEKTYIKEAGVNPDAGRASNDNLLDIIDIVQGDSNLANMAHQNGGNGFAPLPDALHATPKYIDNQAQSTFWANFIAQSNSLGQQAVHLVNSGDTQATNTLIANLHAFQKAATNFDASQGGIFEARFDNELLGNTSTLGAEVTKMIQGLHTGNASLVAAAADEMHANAADVGGNNVPVTGGVFNADGLTLADVLSTATSAPAVAAAVPVAAPVAVAAISPMATPTVQAPTTPAVADTTKVAIATPVVDSHIQTDHVPVVHIDHHMWG